MAKTKTKHGTTDSTMTKPTCATCGEAPATTILGGKPACQDCKEAAVAIEIEIAKVEAATAPEPVDEQSVESVDALPPSNQPLEDGKTIGDLYREQRANFKPGEPMLGALEPVTESPKSVKVNRYVLVGSTSAIDKFCHDKWGMKPDELENVAPVSRMRDIAALRSNTDWRAKRDHSNGAVITDVAIMLLPGWSMVSGLLNDVMLYELASLDGRR